VHRKPVDNSRFFFLSKAKKIKDEKPVP
jgi:hypothetical protein